MDEEGQHASVAWRGYVDAAAEQGPCTLTLC